MHSRSGIGVIPDTLLMIMKIDITIVANTPQPKPFQISFIFIVIYSFYSQQEFEQWHSLFALQLFFVFLSIRNTMRNKTIENIPHLQNPITTPVIPIQTEGNPQQSVHKLTVPNHVKIRFTLFLLLFVKV